jgi:type II secretory pathway pseudopilin PulG
MTARRGARGAVLIEALVGVAIVGIALLFLTGLLAHESTLQRRAAAQEAAYTALEGAIEGVRAGVLPLTPPHQVYDTPAPPFVALPPGSGSILWLDVVETPLSGLYDVTATVRFASGPDLVTRSLATRVWRPDG